MTMQTAQPGPAPEPKRDLEDALSQASRIWFAMVVVVLAILFFQMQGHTQSDSNYCISSDQSAVGATVYIDGQAVGTIARDDEKSGLGEGVFRSNLAQGQHRVEVKKDGYKAFSREVKVRRELYMDLSLTKLSG